MMRSMLEPLFELIGLFLAQVVERRANLLPDHARRRIVRDVHEDARDVVPAFRAILRRSSELPPSQAHP